MARIVVTTFGSSGDINPYIALGLGLRERGHDVVFAVEENARPMVAAAGFATRHLTGDAMGVMTDSSPALLEGMAARTTPLKSVEILVRRYIVPTLPARIADLRAACDGAELLVASTTQVAATFVADLTGIPLAAVTLTPLTVPSAAVEPQPLPFVLPASLRRPANRASWAFGQWAVGRVFDPPVNGLRAQYGLAARRDWMYLGGASPALTAVAISPAFLPPPPDWPPYVRETGFLFWDMPSDWREPDDLTAFLAGSTPVVAVSTGSMSAGSDEIGAAFGAFFRDSIAAVRQVGARALLIGARPNVLPGPLPEGVLALSFAPFSQVYPRCAAAIHHGGIGTTAKALRASVPQLVVPWGVDQFFTGAQVQRVGVGRWMQRRRYTQASAASALSQLLGEPTYRVRAGGIAARIAGEDGVATLCDALEGLLAGAVQPAPEHEW
jgi:UDP:flavonoid glycosyltransferase YjiC (YdhE family)